MTGRTGSQKLLWRKLNPGLKLTYPAHTGNFIYLFNKEIVHQLKNMHFILICRIKFMTIGQHLLSKMFLMVGIIDIFKPRVLGRYPGFLETFLDSIYIFSLFLEYLQ